MATSVHLLISSLAVFLVHPACAVNCNFLCCGNRVDPSDPNPPPKRYLDCYNRPSGDKSWAPDGGWACGIPKVDFPTVDCLTADMKACGNVGQNSVFYSFGARTEQVVPFRDSLNPRG